MPVLSRAVELPRFVLCLLYCVYTQIIPITTAFSLYGILKHNVFFSSSPSSTKMLTNFVGPRNHPGLGGAY